ncbi:MAG: SulP family inorganic anion transporter [Porphyromonas sp.]|nr:SulP family inorganic anion transporter [Porphyromonas sp.]
MSIKDRLVPQFFKEMRKYSRKDFVNDLTAGVIVGVVALPLAIAFGIASGVSPTEGLITAIIGGFLVSFLGGSKVQIGGPTGAFIVIVYGIIQQHGIDGLAIATIMAGIILILLGVMRLGSIIRFVPYPVIVGFTAGIAVTIFSTQVADFLGLQIEELPGDFIGKWQAYFAHMGTFSLTAILFGLISILIITLTPKIHKSIPGSLLALIVLTLASYFMSQMGYARPANIGDAFTFESALPDFRLPDITWAKVQALVPSAITIAMLGAIESLLSASVADGVIGSKHDSNTELVGQGVANIVVPFFGGIPVTGAIARTMANINTGGRTPVGGIVHTGVLLLILLFLGSLTAHIPLAVLAGVLIVVAYNMSGWRSFVAIFRGPKEDIWVLMVTFLLTVLLDLTVAITAGLLLAMLLMLRRLTLCSQVCLLNANGSDFVNPDAPEEAPIHLPKGIDVYEIGGPLFFGIASHFEEVIRSIEHNPRCRIIRMRRVPFIDGTGIQNLQTLIALHKKQKIQIVLSGVQPDVRRELEKTGIVELLGEENITSHITEARARAIAFVREQYPNEYPTAS